MHFILSYFFLHIIFLLCDFLDTFHLYFAIYFMELNANISCQTKAWGFLHPFYNQLQLNIVSSEINVFLFLLLYYKKRFLETDLEQNQKNSKIKIKGHYCSIYVTSHLIEKHLCTIKDGGLKHLSHPVIELFYFLGSFNYIHNWQQSFRSIKLCSGSGK